MSERQTPLLPVVLVDDEAPALQTNEMMLSAGGFNNIRTFQDSREVVPWLEKHAASALFIDLNMPHVSGEQLLETVSQRWPEVPVVVVTGENNVEVAVRCMKLGAYDYMVKPVEEDRLLSMARRAVQWREMRDIDNSFHQRLFSGALDNPDAFAHIITRNRLMITIFQYIESISPSSQPVLITGETGVGKELLAQAVHTLSGRSGPFVAENVAGLDDAMFSDTLFGHVKGAFTGADAARDGLLERARGGTLLLDEIGDIPTAGQVKLLRLLQEMQYFPVGSDVPRSADVRIIATTNQSLEDLQADTSFRNDLFFRLKTHHAHIPPLRGRKDDIPLLVDHFLAEAAAELEKEPPTPPEALYAELGAYSYPGNIRELRAMIHDAVGHHRSHMLSLERIRIHTQSAQIAHDSNSPPSVERGNPFSAMEELPTLKQSDALLIEAALERAQGNQSVAARILGITPSSLSRRLKKE